MEKYLCKISYLEKELAVRDGEVRQAGKYGNQLLEEVADLKAQVEELKQEKHSIQFKLETKSKVVDSQLSECESQKDAITKQERDIRYHKKEQLSMNKKLQGLVFENQELRKSAGELTHLNSSLKRQLSTLEKELEASQNQLHVSLNETNSEECMKLSADLIKCQEERGALLSLVTETEHKLEKSKEMESKYINLIEALRQTINEKNSEIQSYSSIIDKAKEENVELIGQIEMLKLEQVDVNRRGNSVFGEVEDRRKIVERELIILRKKHSYLQENYDIRLAEMRKLKHEFDIFLGMFSQNADSNYIDDLETKLCGAQNEIEYLTKRLAEQMKAQDHVVSTSFVENVPCSDDSYGYLRALLMQSRQRIEELEKELKAQRMLKVAENDELIETKRLLYQSQKRFENLRGETLQLKLKLQDLTMAPGDEKVPQPKKEIIPGFQPIDDVRNEGPNVSIEKGIKTPRLFSPNKGKENCKPNYDLFSALKNPVLASERKAKRDRKAVSFSSATEVNKSVDSEQSQYTPTMLRINDRNNTCAQQ